MHVCVHVYVFVSGLQGKPVRMDLRPVPTEHGSSVYITEIERWKRGSKFRPHLSLKVPVALERLHCLSDL